MKIGESQKISLNGTKTKVIIILPYFNEKIGLRLLHNTVDELLKNKVKKENIEIKRVPGVLEIPLLAQKLILEKKPHVLIALGVVIRGETSHYELVTNTSYQGLMDVSLQTGVPIIFGILACENTKQATQRASKKELNKGKEFAQAAIFQASNIFDL